MTHSPSVKDVAALAGVSIKTVSRVVNGERSVLPATRERVEHAIAELGYVPNTSARTLKSGVGDAVGVVIDTIADPFFASLVSVIEDRALREGMSVQIASTGYDEQREHDQLLRLAGQQVRGVILAPVAREHLYLQRYRAGMPVVMVDRERDGFDSVIVDDQAQAQLAIEQLLALGHTRIAFIGNATGWDTLTRRYEGYRRALEAHGLPLDPHLTPPGVAEVLAARDATASVLGLPRPATAIFAANQRTGYGVASELHRSGRIDVAFISFGDFPFADVLKPAATCIDQDPERIGTAAIERLLELMREPNNIPQRIVVKTELHQRGSGSIPVPVLEGAIPA
jgi:LacI family transcriptional regulator